MSVDSFAPRSESEDLVSHVFDSIAPRLVYDYDQFFAVDKHGQAGCWAQHWTFRSGCKFYTLKHKSQGRAPLDFAGDDA